MNITDVGHLVSDADEGEDKIAREARRRKLSAWELVRFYEEEFRNDIKDLNIFSPQKLVRATQHIKDQINLIKTLEKKGYTYRTPDGIYFDTSKFKDYGKLAGRSKSKIKPGKRIGLKEKRNPTDFALWKFSPETHKRQMEWSSPWGRGFPGWHIECSAMSMKYLGPTLDIHAGGADHIQIHHPNEIAQSEAATGKTFSRFWFHPAFLTIKGTKMAKSLPEANITLQTLKEKGFHPLDFRYLTLTCHYRKPLSFSWEALEGARNARLRLNALFKALPTKISKKEPNFRKKFVRALEDDLNTPRALSILWESLSQNFIEWSDGIFGLNIKKSAAAKASSIPHHIQEMVQKREASRKEKRWQEADEIRKTVEKEGFQINDTPSGPQVSKKD